MTELQHSLCDGLQRGIGAPISTTTLGCHPASQHVAYPLKFLHKHLHMAAKGQSWLPLTPDDRPGRSNEVEASTSPGRNQRIAAASSQEEQRTNPLVVRARSCTHALSTTYVNKNVTQPLSD